MSTNLTVVGNLAADPELRFTRDGKPVATFTVISSTSRKNEAGEWENVDTTGWNVSAWDKLAENVVESLRKGDAVVVVGKAVYKAWEKDDGSKGGRIEVTAFNVAADLKRATAQLTRVSRSTSAPEPKDDPWSSKDGVPF